MTKKKKGKARRFTPADERRVLAFYDKHGSGPTLKKFQLSSGVLHRMKKSRATRQTGIPGAEVPPPGTRSSFTPVIVRVGDLANTPRKGPHRVTTGGSSAPPTKAVLSAVEALVLAQEAVKMIEAEVRAGRSLNTSDGYAILVRDELAGKRT
jgi:hypothetical protein